MTEQIQAFELAAYIPYKLTLAAEKLSTEFSARYREKFGITIAEWRVLVHVSDAGSVSIRDIHQRVHLDKVTASRAASKLVKAGILIKDKNEMDRRLVALTLSKQGEEVMKEILAIAVQFQNQISELLSTDADSFIGALDRILDVDLDTEFSEP
ncbi:MAG: MarR family winged helix-turn-helix transcriptional regulator [Cognatishimia activa]